MRCQREAGGYDQAHKTHRDKQKIQLFPLRYQQYQFQYKKNNRKQHRYE
jgi:hypothetical protein